jgi:hypothetical protein
MEGWVGTSSREFLIIIIIFVFFAVKGYKILQKLRHYDSKRPKFGPKLQLKCKKDCKNWGVYKKINKNRIS